MNRYLRMASNTLNWLIGKSATEEEREKFRKADKHDLARIMRQRSIKLGRKHDPTKARDWTPVPGSKCPIKPMKPFAHNR